MVLMSSLELILSCLRGKCGLLLLKKLWFGWNDFGFLRVIKEKLI